jgi:hypothetical protein
VAAGPPERDELGLPGGLELGLLAAQPALGFRDGHALAGARPGEVGLELGDHRQDGEQQPADRVGGIVDGPAEVQADAAGRQLVDDVSGIRDGAGEPVEFGDHEGVARPAGGEGLAQAGALSVGAADAVVDVDAVRLDAQRGEGLPLGGEVLPVGGDPGVADLDRGHGGSITGCPTFIGHLRGRAVRERFRACSSRSYGGVGRSRRRVA